MTEEQLLAWTAGFLAGWDEGYEVRGREVNAEYPPPKIYLVSKRPGDTVSWWDQAEQRRKADAEVRRLVAEERAR